MSRMLDDFPLLLDIRSCQVAEASCYLSELFAGYEGRGETAQHKFGAARMLDALQGGPDDDGADDGRLPPPLHQSQGHRKALSCGSARRLPVLDEVQARRRVARGPRVYVPSLFRIRSE